MKLAILLLFILPIIIFAQKNLIDNRVIPESYFTVVAPNNIRRGKPYNVYVRGFNIKRTTKLEIRISGKSDSGTPLNIRKTVLLSRDSSRASVKIDTSNIVKGSYILSVEGEKFLEKRTLTYFTNNFIFLLQFSKAIYLPGDLFQFRVFAIDSETKSVNPTGPSTLSILDPKGNIITSFNNITFRKGKYENQFQLSNKASLGIWSVQFQYEDEDVSKDFHVDTYIRPMIHGKITIPAETPYSFKKVPVSIDILYTFDRGPSGTAHLIISQNSDNIFKRFVKIDSGTAKFDLDIKKDLKLESEKSGLFEAKLSFEDELTGLKVTDSKSFTVISNVFGFLTTADTNFIPGIPFKFTIIMIKYDGSPAPAGTKIQIIPSTLNVTTKKTLTLGSDGTVSSSAIASDDVEFISLLVTAKDSEDGSVFGPKYQKDFSFLEFFVLTRKPRLNEPVQLKLSTGEEIDSAIVHIVSKGILLDSFRVWFDEDPKFATFSFKPTFKHAPLTRAIAYYINKKGNFIIADAVILFDNELPNYVNIIPHTNQVKPGSNAILSIESNVDSTVSLVAVDQRRLLLDQEFGFSKKNIYEDLNKYHFDNIIFDWENVAEYELTFGHVGLFIFTNIPRPPNTSDWTKRPAVKVKRRRHHISDDLNQKLTYLRNRHDLKEVFLWRDVDINHFLYDDAEGDEYYNGIETISEKVPESITTYLIYGVAMSKYDGLGLSDNLPSVTVFLPFFLSVELPHSIKRNEVLIQDIFLFNYLKQSQTVEVKITKDSKFDGVDLVKYGWKVSNGFYVKTIATKIGQHLKLQFALRPIVLGFAPFEITVKGPLAGDGLKKQLRIIPEGVSRSIIKYVLIAIEDVTVHESLQCDIPDSAYYDTTEISATVVGDIFSKSLNSVDKLIDMADGDGEQTIIRLSINIVVYEHLKSVNKLTPTLKTTLENYILAGYQNELKYQRGDGSFSAFGDSDPSGSAWLTAYVGQYFYLAKDIVTIDSNVIKRAAEFVKQQQNTPDGSFKEPGRVIYTDMQGGSGNGIALTAYCALFFTFILPGYPEYTTVRNNAIKYLEDNLSKVTSTYDLGVIAYALQLAGSSKASDAFDSFYAKRTEKSSLIFWSVSIPPLSQFLEPKSLDIEVTSYGLLNIIQKCSYRSDLLKIMNFILSKSNIIIGHISLQDTVMALYALNQFIKKFSHNVNVNLTLIPNDGPVIKTEIDSTNLHTLQNFDLNNIVRKLNIEASSSSTGLASVNLVCNFFEDPTKVSPAFKVEFKRGFFCSHIIMFQACASYILSESSNMAVMTVSLPSGFIYGKTEQDINVSHTEISNKGAIVIFYINNITSKKICVDVRAHRKIFVPELENGTIAVNDYYDTTKEGIISYSVGKINHLQCGS